MELTLVVMAAGLGSRYGGLKQIDPVGKNGEIILEYALHDALQAGFRKVVFVIKEEMLADFKEIAGDRIAQLMEVSYAFQRLEDIPQGFTVPQGRVKPWGTGQALLAARGQVQGPFCVVNADDFYGRDAFMQVGNYLKTVTNTAPWRCCMAGYAVENTLTENGTVSRGICTADSENRLTAIVERTKLHREGDHVLDDESGAMVALGTPVSLNLWGFPQGALDELEAAFAEFLQKNVNPLKGEFYLPSFVDGLIRSGSATVQVLPTDTHWYGVTYHEDREPLVAAIAKMTAEGTYPPALFR